MSDPRIPFARPPRVKSFMERHGPLKDEFWVQIPKDAPAVFSTRGGKRARRFHHPREPRSDSFIVRSCDEAAFLEMIEFLWRELPDECEKVTIPRSFHDLHQYFDPVDLWSYTAGFLGDIVEAIATQNIEKKAILTEGVEEWLDIPEIYEQMIKIPVGKMMFLLTPENREYLGYDGFRPSEKKLFLSIVNQRREKMELLLSQPFLAQQDELEQLSMAAKQATAIKHQEPTRERIGRGMSGHPLKLPK